jgi:hypothetical protein
MIYDVLIYARFGVGEIMTYDWNGQRTKRLRAAKLCVAVTFASAMIFTMSHALLRSAGF